jgi:hypothetical protein
MLTAWVIFVIRAAAGISGAFAPATWQRYDSSWYLNIAKYGYTAQWHCGGHSIPPHLPPGNYLCGTVQWFPGYSLILRAVSSITRMPLAEAALLVSWSCWYLFLVVMWRLLRDAVSTATRWACLLLCAFSPGAIYYPAVFPISTAMLAIAATLYCAYRSPSRWAPAGAFLAGLVAGCSYVSSIALAPGLLVGLVFARRTARRPIIAGAAGVACGFGGVLIAQQLIVGIWDGYFIAQSKYATGTHNPFVGWAGHLEALWETDLPKQGLLRAIAEQSAFTAALLGLAVLALLAGLIRQWPLRLALDRRAQAVKSTPSPFPANDTHPPDIAESVGVSMPVEHSDRRVLADGVNRPAQPEVVAATGGGLLRRVAALRARISPLDATALATAATAWVIAYSAGARISVWRSEAFVVFAVLLLRRLRAWWIVVPLLAAAYVASNMSWYFFHGGLI